MNNNRPRGATGLRLNREKLTELVGRELAYADNVLIKVSEGYAVVNTEGVGMAERDRTVGVYCLGAFEYVIVHVDVDELAQLTEDEVDLADFIRTFGGRLNANHYTWFRRVTGN